MSVKVIEIVQLFVDRIHQGGYQHRVLEDDIYAESQRRIATEKERDHWRQARQDAIEAGELMKAEIESLRRQLADAKREASDEFVERQVLTAEQQQDTEIWQQQVDGALADVKILKTQLDDARVATLNTQALLDAARAETVEVRRRLNEERDAAEAAVSLQRAGIERLQAFVGKVRKAMWPEDLRSALAELDAGNSEPAHCPECVKLRAFVDGIEHLLKKDRFDRRDIAELLIVLRSNSSATLNSSAVKDCLTPAAEDVK